MVVSSNLTRGIFIAYLIVFVFLYVDFFFVMDRTADNEFVLQMDPADTTGIGHFCFTRWCEIDIEDAAKAMIFFTKMRHPPPKELKIKLSSPGKVSIETSALNPYEFAIIHGIMNLDIWLTPENILSTSKNILRLLVDQEPSVFKVDQQVYDERASVFDPPRQSRGSKEEVQRTINENRRRYCEEMDKLFTRKKK